MFPRPRQCSLGRLPSGIGTTRLTEVESCRRKLEKVRLLAVAVAEVLHSWCRNIAVSGKSSASVSSIPKVQEIPTPFPSRSGLHSAPNGLMCYSVYDNVMATNVSTGKVQTVFLRKVCTFRQQMLIDA